MLRLSAIALVLIAAGSVHAAEKTLDRAFTVSPGGELVVDADGASVHVSGNDGNQVIVHMVFGGSESDLDDIKLDAIQKDNGVTVTARKPKRNWFWWGSWGKQEIEVTVPRRYGVSVRTGGGSIEPARHYRRRVIAHLRRQHIGEECDWERRDANLRRFHSRRYDRW